MNPLDEIKRLRRLSANLPHFKYLKSKKECIRYAGMKPNIDISPTGPIMTRIKDIEVTKLYINFINIFLIDKGINCYVLAVYDNLNTIDHQIRQYIRAKRMLEAPAIQFKNYHLDQVYAAMSSIFQKYYSNIYVDPEVYSLREDVAITRKEFTTGMSRRKMNELVDIANTSHPYYVRTFMIVNKFDLTLTFQKNMDCILSMEDISAINNIVNYKKYKRRIDTIFKELVLGTHKESTRFTQAQDKWKELVNICKINSGKEEDKLYNYALLSYAIRNNKKYMSYDIDTSKHYRVVLRNPINKTIAKGIKVPVSSVDISNAIYNFADRISHNGPREYLMTKYVNKVQVDGQDCPICMEPFDSNTVMQHPIKFCFVCNNPICTKCFLACKTRSCPFCRSDY